MNDPKYKHSARSNFSAAESKAQKLIEAGQRKLEAVEAKRATALHYAQLLDRIGESKEAFVQRRKILREISDYPLSQFVADFVTGHKVEDCAIRLFTVEKLKAVLPEIEKLLYRQIVEPNEKLAKDFFKQNESVLKRAKFRAIPESPCIPPPPADEW
jgi:hypothetical protein